MNLFVDIDWLTVVKSIGLMAGLAILFGILIIIVNKFFEVKVDSRISEVQEHLAGSNCGGCGHPGCAGFAKALVDGKASINDCPQTSKTNKAEIGNILGLGFSGGEETMAVVACSGGILCEDKYEYQGYGNCQSQQLLANGSKSCDVGCMGTGSCVDACPSYAIQVGAGVAKVDPSNCTSCGLCISNCPKKLIKRIPRSAKVYVACSTLCKGKEVTTMCKAGCIGCGLCVKACPSDALHMVNNVPVYDYSKCDGCLKCFDKCPRKVIHKL